jgi:hypothetical protein
MKTKMFLFQAIWVLAFLMVSCSPEDLASCDSVDLGDDLSCPSSVDAVATFCSDGTTNAYYTYKGSKYECTGTESSTCNDARSKISAKLIEAGCSGKKSGSLNSVDVKLSAMAEKLLLEVKSKSLCN